MSRQGEPPPPVVYAVDDDPSFLPALVRRLQADGLQVLSFPSAQAFLDAAPHADVACAVIDLHMPGTDGLALQRRIATLSPPLPVVFLTGQGSIERSVEAMKNGAVDFLQKPVRGERLVSAVRSAIAHARAAYERRQQTAHVRERYLALTPREREVFALVVQGLLNKQIAWQLGTAERTIKAHRRQVMQKTGAASLADLVRLAQILDGTGLPMPEPPPPVRADLRG